MTTDAPTPPQPQPKPLLGLRRKRGRLALAVFRMPLRAYDHGAGRLLGHTFLEFTHTGRRSGRAYRTVAMVLRHDPATREAVVVAAWGPDSDWVKNLRAGPAVSLQLGRDAFVPEHRFLPVDEAVDVAVQFRREHPGRLRLISAALGWPDLTADDALAEFVRTHPFVAFRPAAATSAGR
jgi:deazaflavin-dependent oxidoreductase (nitroreductase family)